MKTVLRQTARQMVVQRSDHSHEWVEVMAKTAATVEPSSTCASTIIVSVARNYTYKYHITAVIAATAYDTLTF